MSSRSQYDAVIIGSGPNGLSAGITLAQAGCSVLLLEAADTIGGGLRSDEMTLPGFVHDPCAAILPLSLASPFFSYSSARPVWSGMDPLTCRTGPSYG
jgi:phytoene dehydrogenase-like protein